MSKFWRGRPRCKQNVEKRVLPMRSMGFGVIALAALALAAPSSALANEGLKHEERPRHFSWSFAGVFGHYDQAQLRRGFKIYREVCSSCHSIIRGMYYGSYKEPRDLLWILGTRTWRKAARCRRCGRSIRNCGWAP